MRNLLLKASFLLISLMLIKGLANFIIPSAKVLDALTVKEIDQSTEAAFNTLFIGTSRIKRGVIPAVIDSINPGMRTYNFGENHFAFPYTCQWLEDHLQDLPKMEMIVVEMTGPGEEILDFKTWYPYALASFDGKDGWSVERKTLAILRENLLKTYFSPITQKHIH